MACKYDEVIIALDKDATLKSMHCARRLQPFVKTKVLILDRDLKHETLDQLLNLLG